MNWKKPENWKPFRKSGNSRRCTGTIPTREQRQEVVAKLRAEGWSYRRIGERLGVDPKTAHGDAISGVENSTPAPAVVTGADGKVYPATRPAVVT